MRVLITGGSEGIGLAFAKHYLSCGNEVIIASKREEKLKEAKNILETEYGLPVRTVQADLSISEDVQKLYETCDGDSLDVLVQCAGFGFSGESWKRDIGADEDLVRVNDIALMTLTKLFVKGHIEQKKGTVINVSSTGGFQPGPYIASYYASKSFVTSYSVAVDEEVREYGLRVYCLCPGPVDTGFYDKSGGTMSAYHMSAEDTVKYCLKHLGGKSVIIPGAGNRLMRLLPERIRISFLKKTKKV